jgi:hypothetical protein
MNVVRIKIPAKTGIRGWVYAYEVHDDYGYVSGPYRSKTAAMRAAVAAATSNAMRNA